MATGKKSFLLYSDLLPTIKKLIEKDRLNKTNNSGELFYHILMYVSDENPEAVNDIVDLMFEPIKTQLKRDLIKWDVRAERSRENGQKGGRPKNLEEPNETQITQQVILEPEKPDTVNVSVSVNDNVNDSDILLKKETKFIFKRALLDFGFKENIVDDWLIVRKNKKASNTKIAYEAFIEEIQSRNCDINEILKICVEKSWSGFKFKWIDNLKNETNGITTTQRQGTGTTMAEQKQAAIDGVNSLFGK